MIWPDRHQRAPYRPWTERTSDLPAEVAEAHAAHLRSVLGDGGVLPPDDSDELIAPYVVPGEE